MNNLEPLIIELFKEDKISFDQTVELIRILKENNDKNVSFKCETKSGIYLQFGIPSDLVKINVNKLFDKVTFKKDNKQQEDKDDLIENILKIIK